MPSDRLYRRITFRVAPLVMLLYFVAFLDRVNIGFASLTMNRDLGISETLYGFAAGIFFIGYLLFAVPSNYALMRVGAPRWMGLLMVAWGLVGCTTAFVHGPVTYIALRFLLGVAESGFLPGVVFYLTRWLPGSSRGRIMALLYLAIPLSTVIGSPLSATILRMNGWHGLAGWQWLFLLEALPAVLLGGAVPCLMDEGPQTATWLTETEKLQLARTMKADASANTAHTNRPSMRLRMATTTVMAFAYFTLMIGLYELGFWTPKLLASFGVPLRTLGWLNAVPYTVGALVLLPWAAFSDRSGDRRYALVVSFLCAAMGFTVAAFAASVTVSIYGLSLAAFGVFVSMPVFWAATSQRVPAASAALAIAVVNSCGNVGGFLGPYATGWLLARTHLYSVGLLTTAGALLLGAGLVAFGFAPLNAKANA